MKQHENLQYVTGLESEVGNITTLTCIFLAEDTGNIYIVRQGQSTLINSTAPVITGFTGDITIATTDTIGVEEGIIKDITLT